MKCDDFKLAERLAHTIKGVSAALGANELSKISSIIETAIREGKDINKKSWSAFSGKLGQIFGSLKKLVPEGDGSQSEERDYSKIKLLPPLIHSMKADVQMGLFMDLAPYFAEIEKIEPDGKRLAGHLKELADQFDEEGILKVLEQITGHG